MQQTRQKIGHGRSRRRKQSGFPTVKILVCVVGLSLLISLALTVFVARNHESMEEKPKDIQTLSREKVAVHPHDKSYEYVQSFKTLGRKLKFFHIPKTAGTAVEFAAATKNIAWGSCSFIHKPKRHVCPYPEGALWPEHVAWWHLPPYVFPLGNINPYRNAELFAVVRDPFERMVSEFYYICTLTVKDWRPDQCNRTRLMDPEYFNAWLSNKMNEQSLGQPKAIDYLRDNAHFVPQSDFLFGPHGQRMIDHVLQMNETLGYQFNLLMSSYNLTFIELEKRKALGGQEVETGSQLQVANLSQSIKAKITDIYRNDIHLLAQ